MKRLSPGGRRRRSGGMEMRMIGTLAICALTMAAQQYPAGEMKHLQMPIATSVRPISVAALEIERELHYLGVIHLKGRVEVKTPVCIVTGSGTAQVCDGY